MYQKGALPRRAFLGLQIAPSPTSPGAGGVRVAGVFDASAASQAGLHAGDLLRSIDGRALRDAAQLVDVARRVRIGDRVVFEVEQDGRLVDLEAEAPPLPTEQMEEGEVLLAHVRVADYRLRTIFAVPHSPGPHPAVLYLQGLRADSCEAPLHPDRPLRHLVQSWVRAGFIVMRVERCGVGDSEGPSCRSTDLQVEIDGYLAALLNLQSFEEVDPNRVFLFGCSFGGMVAPLVARERSVAGVAVFGTSALRWHDCVLAGARRQRVLSGYVGSWLDEEMARRAELGVEVYREGSTPAQVFEQRPHLVALRSRDCDGDTMYGRHVTLFQQLDAVDLTAAWQHVGARILVAHGEYDWICSAEEARAIAASAGRHARFVELPLIGHDMLAHESLTQSFRSPVQGQWDGRVADATLAWMCGGSEPSL